MSAATVFLSRWIQSGLRQKPSITLVTCQPPDQNLPPGRWTTGIVNYSVGINGTVTRNAAGEPKGLKFSSLYSVFSDRITNPGATPPAYQRFNANSSDKMEVHLELDGDAVRADVHIITWGARWSVRTIMTDSAGQSTHLPGCASRRTCAAPGDHGGVAAGNWGVRVSLRKSERVVLGARNTGRSK